MPSDQSYLNRVRDLTANTQRQSPAGVMTRIRDVVEEWAEHRAKVPDPRTRPLEPVPMTEEMRQAARAPQIRHLPEVANPTNCCICLNTRSGRATHTPAVAVAEGYSLCLDHLQWLRDEAGYHDRTYRMLIQEALKRHTTSRRSV